MTIYLNELENLQKLTNSLNINDITEFQFIEESNSKNIMDEEFTNKDNENKSKESENLEKSEDELSEIINSFDKLGDSNSQFDLFKNLLKSDNNILEQIGNIGNLCEPS